MSKPFRLECFVRFRRGVSMEHCSLWCWPVLGRQTHPLYGADLRSPDSWGRGWIPCSRWSWVPFLVCPCRGGKVAPVAGAGRTSSDRSLRDLSGGRASLLPWTGGARWTCGCGCSSLQLVFQPSGVNGDSRDHHRPVCIRLSYPPSSEGWKKTCGSLPDLQIFFKQFGHFVKIYKKVSQLQTMSIKSLEKECYFDVLSINYNHCTY